MDRSFTFRITLASAVCCCIAAVFGAFWLARDNPGYPVGELTRVEVLPGDVGEPLAGHVLWTFEVMGGEREITERDMEERFAASFSAGFPAAALNASVQDTIAELGPVRFVRNRIVAEGVDYPLAVVDDGSPLFATVGVDDDGRIESWGLDNLDSPPRLPGWQSTLVLLAAWLCIGACLDASRSNRMRQAWVLLLCAEATVAAVLILGSSSVSYTIGRVAPALVIVFAAWLLIEPKGEGFGGGAVLVATGSAVVSLVTPFVRDTRVIGHPDVVGAFADSANTYRILLVLGALSGAVAMLWVAVRLVLQLVRANPWGRSPMWAGVVTASVWGGALLVAAVDYAFSSGSLASSGMQAVTLGALVVVPGVVAFRSATMEWDRSELADLVIDLESGGTDLERAIAQAFDDPSVRLLTSPDGRRLVDSQGNDALPSTDGRTITRIRSGSGLVGGIESVSSRHHRPERMRAMAAAVGMALEVGRLNEQVHAQLAAAEASRSRIVDASDDARRRIERDLHDGAQQRLVALGIDLQGARRIAVQAGIIELADRLDEATMSVRGAIEDIRHVAQGSNPPLLRERGLGAAIDALVERAPVAIDVDVDASELSPEVERTVYFVVAEGLTNMAKHAGARSGSVSVLRRGGEVQVVVSDDGQGGAVIAAGSGLQGLSDRVAAAGGTLALLDAEPGTTIEVLLPCA